MTPGDRRTTEELIALYELESEVRDIYVEGPADLYLIKWFLGQIGKGSIVVYDISTVEISAEMVQFHGLDNNNRDRVIVLALELERRLGQESVQVTCIADRDFDLILNHRHDCNLLLFTDYTGIEMYLFNEGCIDKFFNVCLRGFPFPAGHVIGQLINILQEVFLIRLANKLLGLKLNWMTFERCCKLSGGGIIFNTDDFITRYLNKNDMLERKDKFVYTVNSWRPKLTSNPRYQMHGHDFIELLAWYLKKHGVDSKLSDSKFVERSLFGCIEIELLANETLFKHLINRVQR